MTRKNKAISIADLLDRKDKIKEKKNETKQLWVESLQGYIEVKKPSRELVAEALDATSPSEGDSYILYECVISPNLKDPELQKGFGCVEPMDIVDLIFEPGEVGAISINCIEFAGYGGLKSEDEKIKKK